MQCRHLKNYNDPGHAHELTFSCYQRFAFLQRERTCHWLAAAIEAGREKLKFQLWA
jgi:putative transposase